MSRPADVSWFLAIDRKDCGPTEAALTLSGRLGRSVAAQLAEAVAQAIDAGKINIVLDLSGVDYISSAGMLAVEQAGLRLHELAGSLTLTGVQEPVKLALNLAGPLAHTSITSV